MTKVNISTYRNSAFMSAVRRYLDENPAVVDTRKYLAAGSTAVASEVARPLLIRRAA
jgi:fructose-bisphosphate aldolase class II